MPSQLKTVSIFGDESGSHSSDTLVSIGMVVSTAPDEDLARLQAVRQQNKCNREIKYEKTDRLILPTCKGWIDAFAASPSLCFRATILRPRTRRRYLQQHYKAEVAVPRAEKLYNKHYCNLIRYVRRDVGLGSSLGILAFLDERKKTEGDNFSFYLRKEIPAIRDLQFVDSKSHELNQLADLLNGCLRAEFAGVVANETKRAKVDYLLAALGVRRFGHLKPNRKFLRRQSTVAAHDLPAGMRWGARLRAADSSRAWRGWDRMRPRSAAGRDALTTSTI